MKISQLANATVINDEDLFPVVQDDETKKVSAKTLLGNQPTDVTVTEDGNLQLIAGDKPLGGGVKLPATDQTYDPTSENAQSGVAVAEAFSEKFNTVGTGKNLFNPDDEDIVVGKLFNDNGELSVTNPSYLTSGYIEVEEGKTYFSSVKRNDTRYSIIRSYAFYDENKGFISGSGTSAANGQITIPTDQNIKYIRFSTYSISYGGSEWQFEADERTDYESYHLVYDLNENVRVPYLEEDVGNLKENLNNFKEEVQSNEKFIKTSASLNLFNFDEALPGKFNDDTALINSDDTTFISSNPIYINGYDKIVFQCYSNTIIPRASLFYDENMNLVAHYSTVYDGKLSAVAYPDTCWQPNVKEMTENGNLCVIPIPKNAYYYAFSSPLTTKETIMIYGVKGENVKYVYPVPYQSYIEAYRLKQDILPVERFIKSYFNGKKLIAIGDSITYGTHNAGGLTPWLARVATMFNMTFVNYGIGGSELAKNKADGSYNPMCIRYAEMDADADLIIVAGGTNDWGHIAGNTVAEDTEYQMGEFGDTEITTFYGALDTMCKGLLEKYVGKTIFFMTPIKRYSALSTPYYTENNRGHTLEDYANAIKKVCGFYGIPVLDMFNECSLNPIIDAISTAYIEDGTHPNSKGHMIMARQIAGFISSLKNDIDYN